MAEGQLGVGSFWFNAENNRSKAQATLDKKQLDSRYNWHELWDNILRQRAVFSIHNFYALFNLINLPDFFSNEENKKRFFAVIHKFPQLKINLLLLKHSNLEIQDVVTTRNEENKTKAHSGAQKLMAFIKSEANFSQEVDALDWCLKEDFDTKKIHALYYIFRTALSNQCHGNQTPNISEIANLVNELDKPESIKKIFQNCIPLTNSQITGYIRQLILDNQNINIGILLLVAFKHHLQQTIGENKTAQQLNPLLSNLFNSLHNILNDANLKEVDYDVILELLKDDYLRGRLNLNTDEANKLMQRAQTDIRFYWLIAHDSNLWNKIPTNQKNEVAGNPYFVARNALDFAYINPNTLLERLRQTPALRTTAAAMLIVHNPRLWSHINPYRGWLGFFNRLFGWFESKIAQRKNEIENFGLIFKAKLENKDILTLGFEKLKTHCSEEIEEIDESAVVSNYLEQDRLNPSTAMQHEPITSNRSAAKLEVPLSSKPKPTIASSKPEIHKLLKQLADVKEHAKIQDLCSKNPNLLQELYNAADPHQTDNSLFIPLFEKRDRTALLASMTDPKALPIILNEPFLSRIVDNIQTFCGDPTIPESFRTAVIGRPGWAQKLLDSLKLNKNLIEALAQNGSLKRALLHLKNNSQTTLKAQDLVALLDENRALPNYLLVLQQVCDNALLDQIFNLVSEKQIQQHTHLFKTFFTNKTITELRSLITDPITQTKTVCVLKSYQEPLLPKVIGDDIVEFGTSEIPTSFLQYVFSINIYAEELLSALTRKADDIPALLKNRMLAHAVSYLYSQEHLNFHDVYALMESAEFLAWLKGFCKEHLKLRQELYNAAPEKSLNYIEFFLSMPTYLEYLKSNIKLCAENTRALAVISNEEFLPRIIDDILAFCSDSNIPEVFRTRVLNTGNWANQLLEQLKKKPSHIEILAQNGALASALLHLKNNQKINPQDLVDLLSKNEAQPNYLQVLQSIGDVTLVVKMFQLATLDQIEQHHGFFQIGFEDKTTIDMQNLLAARETTSKASFICALPNLLPTAVGKDVLEFACNKRLPIAFRQQVFSQRHYADRLLTRFSDEKSVAKCAASLKESIKVWINIPSIILFIFNQTNFNAFESAFDDATPDDFVKILEVVNTDKIKAVFALENFNQVIPVNPDRVKQIAYKNLYFANYVINQYKGYRHFIFEEFLTFSLQLNDSDARILFDQWTTNPKKWLADGLQEVAEPIQEVVKSRINLIPPQTIISPLSLGKLPKSNTEAKRSFQRKEYANTIKIITAIFQDNSKSYERLSSEPFISTEFNTKLKLAFEKNECHNDIKDSKSRKLTRKQEERLRYWCTDMLRIGFISDDMKLHSELREPIKAVLIRLPSFLLQIPNKFYSNENIVKAIIESLEERKGPNFEDEDQIHLYQSKLKVIAKQANDPTISENINNLLVALARAYPLNAFDLLFPNLSAKFQLIYLRYPELASYLVADLENRFEQLAIEKREKDHIKKNTADKRTNLNSFFQDEDLKPAAIAILTYKHLITNTRILSQSNFKVICEVAGYTSDDSKPLLKGVLSMRRDIAEFLQREELSQKRKLSLLSPVPISSNETPSPIINTVSSLPPFSTSTTLSLITSPSDISTAAAAPETDITPISFKAPPPPPPPPPAKLPTKSKIVVTPTANSHSDKSDAPKKSPALFKGIDFAQLKQVQLRKTANETTKVPNGSSKNGVPVKISVMPSNKPVTLENILNYKNTNDRVKAGNNYFTLLTHMGLAESFKEFFSIKLRSGGVNNSCRNMYCEFVKEASKEVDGKKVRPDLFAMYSFLIKVKDQFIADDSETEKLWKEYLSILAEFPETFKSATKKPQDNLVKFLQTTIAVFKGQTIDQSFKDNLINKFKNVNPVHESSESESDEEWEEKDKERISPPRPK